MHELSASHPSPASFPLLQLPDAIIDIIATLAGPPARLICKRLCDAAPIRNLRLLPHSTAWEEQGRCYIADAYKPALLRSLDTLMIDDNWQADGYDMDACAAANQVVVYQAAVHCTALRQLRVTCASDTCIAHMASPSSTIHSTLRVLSLVMDLWSIGDCLGLPRLLAPLSRFTNLQLMSLELLSHPEYYNEAPPDDADIHLFAPIFTLTQLTDLRLAAHKFFGLHGGLCALPQLIATHLPRLMQLELEVSDPVIRWDVQAAGHLSSMTALTKLVLTTDPHMDSVAFFRALSALPGLHELSLHFEARIPAELSSLFRCHAPPGVSQRPPALRSLALEMSGAYHSSESTDLSSVVSSLHGTASALTRLSIRGERHPAAGGGLHMPDHQCLRQLAASLPRLCELSLNSCNMYSAPLTPLTALAGTVAALTFLNCGNPDPSDVPRLTQLRVLCADAGQWEQPGWCRVQSQLCGVELVGVLD